MPKITFMSSPKTTAGDRRTYLIKADGEPSYMVRIYPRGPNAARVVCDCPIGKARKYCEHVRAVSQHDVMKFHGDKAK